RMRPLRSALSGSRFSTDIALTLLPEPDSPTRATVVFSGMSNEMPLTASARTPRPMRNETLRSWIDSSIGLFQSPELGVERVAGGVGHQRERRHEHGHERGGGDELLPVAEDQLALRLGEHRAPAHLVDRHAEAEVRQDHLGLDEADDEQA